MSWAHGRQLEGVTTGGKEIGFSYDKDGLRLGKSVGSTGYAYLWAGGRLAEQKWGDNRIIFSYDESGAPQSFYYRNASNSGENYGWGTKYYYVLNAQGDVVQLRDQNNAVVANYQYDAWGKLLYVYDNAGTEITDADHIALINPLRYRGYYYDSETGFYYLQSRYYDPVIRRFINADGYVSTGQGLLGYNMFTYCGNNPVNYADSSGTFSIGFFMAAFALAIGFVTAVFLVVDALSRPAVRQGISDTMNSAGKAVHDAIERIKPKPKIKDDTREKDIAKSQFGNEKKREVFPMNPYDFKPNGLIRTEYSGKNGKIIKWQIPETKVAIFEWNEDQKYGPHYHAMLIEWDSKHVDGKHYAPGSPVPEPWNTMYFGG